MPHKNIRMLAGKPLIAHAIETALRSSLIDRVVVSTDDSEISAIAQRFGAEVPFMRPAELASDNSPERAAWQHAIRELKETGSGPPPDVFVAIPTTAPLRTAETVDHCIKTFLESDADIVITVRPAERSPYYNMVVLDQDSCARLVIPPNQSIHQRHDAPAVYDMTTVAYVARPEFVLNTDYIFDGKVKAVVVSPEISLDIDSELDLKFAEFVLNHGDSGTRG